MAWSAAPGRADAKTVSVQHEYELKKECRYQSALLFCERVYFEGILFEFSFNLVCAQHKVAESGKTEAGEIGEHYAADEDAEEYSKIKIAK